MPATMKVAGRSDGIAGAEEQADTVQERNVVVDTGVRQQVAQACIVAGAERLCRIVAPVHGESGPSVADAQTVCDDHWNASCWCPSSHDDTLASEVRNDHFVLEDEIQEPHGKTAGEVENTVRGEQHIVAALPGGCTLVEGEHSGEEDQTQMAVHCTTCGDELEQAEGRNGCFLVWMRTYRHISVEPEHPPLT
jgi:hypothetical protein